MLIGVDASRAVVVQRTGTETYSLHLVRALLARAGEHRVRLYHNAPPPDGLYQDRSPAEPRVMPFPRLWTHVRLSLEMLLHAPDVLLVPAHVLPLIHPRASVVTVHDLGHRFYPEAHTRTQRSYLEWSTRYHVRTAAHLLADSAATRDDLVRLYGAAPDRVTVAHLGVDPDLAPVRDCHAIEDVKRRHGIDGSYVLYLGTLQPRKNLLRLIAAFEIVAGRGERRDVSLVLAGKRGWLYDDILAAARRSGLGERVCVTGYVDDADRAALYSGAALFAMPSLYEGFCMPVLEAMACGTPVVCSSTSSLPEIAGDAALAFDPHNVGEIARAMQRVLDDPALRADLVKRGTARAAQFTWEACAAKVLAVLESVAHDTRGRKAP